MRARYPDREGVVSSAGVPIAWEEYGAGEPAVLFLPPWQIVHSRIWKAQLAYFARHLRVITYDRAGNGRSGRPATDYSHDQCAAERWRCSTPPPRAGRRSSASRAAPGRR